MTAAELREKIRLLVPTLVGNRKQAEAAAIEYDELTKFPILKKVIIDLLTHELGESFSNYPPMLNGMRGSHQGSFEVAHALAWTGQKPTSYKDLNEEYDLVIVGAGISGLAAARFYQQKMAERALSPRRSCYSTMGTA